MARVRFVEQALQVEVPIGTSLLEAARRVGAPLGDACGGHCACSTCHVYVDRGRELLRASEDDEEDALDRAFDVRDSSRLGCQARIEREGEVVVRISGESLTAYRNEHPEDSTRTQ
jgi:2Fe-2S ferredoxin